MRQLWALALVVGFMVPGLASAQDLVDSQSVVIEEANGLYTVVKTVNVFTNPAGGFDYLYQLANSPLCPAGPPCSTFGIKEYTVPVGAADPDCPVALSDVSFNPGTGDLEPASVGVESGQVRWVFSPDALAPGQTSVELTLHSVCAPGPLTPDLVSLAGEFGFDAQGECVGPQIPPVVTDTGLSCPASFWKDRAHNPRDEGQFCADRKLQTVCDTAAALSQGYYEDCEALLEPLLAKSKTKKAKKSKKDKKAKKGKKDKKDKAKKSKKSKNKKAKNKKSKKSKKKKSAPSGVSVAEAERELSALLLNLASGAEFPDNDKCRLVPGLGLDNSCSNPPVSATNIGEAVDAIIELLQTGHRSDREAAHDCAADINNAIGVQNTVPGP